MLLLKFSEDDSFAVFVLSGIAAMLPFEDGEGKQSLVPIGLVHTLLHTNFMV